MSEFDYLPKPIEAVRKEKKIHLGKCCLLVKAMLTFTLCIMFEDSLKLESCRFLTYILRFKDYMNKDSTEIHTAFTKQLNIRAEREMRKNNFYSQAAMPLK